MTVAFDTLTAAEAMESAGVEHGHARAIAAQMHAAAGAVDAVTRPELKAMLAALKAALLDRIAESERTQNERSARLERRLLDRIARSERAQGERSAELERGLRDRIAQSEQTQVERSTELERGLLDRISQSERRMTALLWRLFGAMVAVATASVAALRYLA